jgi:micrococcal nuclease
MDGTAFRLAGCVSDKLGERGQRCSTRSRAGRLAAMVRDGFAWRYVRYDEPGEFTAAEREARDGKRGLWADPHPVPPWEWRRAKRGTATTK